MISPWSPSCFRDWAEGGELPDPFGGQADLEARTLRLASEDALRRDPLRTLRLQWKARAVDDAVVAGMREQIKSLELEAERTLLSRLEGVAQEWTRNDAGSVTWLEDLAGNAASLNRDALQVLRVAATGT